MLRSRASTLRCIAANVQEWRNRRELTQAELAERAQLDLRMIQRVERAERDFAVTVFVRIAEVLDVKLDLLVRPAALGRARRGRPSKRP